MINIRKITIAMTPAMAIIIAILFMIMPAAGAIQAEPAQAASSIQPNIELNSNATWNTFYNSWTPLEYEVNSTANATLPANLSSFYQNPISVNPGDIIAPGILQNNAVGGVYWNTSTVLGPGGTTLTVDNVTFSTYNITTNGVTEKQEEADIIGATTGADAGQGIIVKAANYPSQNPAYDYLTIIISASTTGGANAQVNIVNSTGVQIQIGTSITSGTEYLSMNLQEIEDKYHIGLNTTAGTGYSSQIQVLDHITVPSGAPVSKDYTTLTGLAMSTSPYILGYNSTGSAITSGIGNIEMAKFSPQNFKYTEIANGGYSVAVSQPLQKETETQTPLSGSYTEQVEYSGTLGNMSGPGLSFSPANITISQDIPQKQIQVLEVNGVSYISGMNATGSNKTMLIMSANPGTTYTTIDITDYTTSQWQSISSPAGFFQNPSAWIEGGIFSALIVVVGFLGFKGLGKTLSGDKANEENHARILNGKKGR